MSFAPRGTALRTVPRLRDGRRERGQPFRRRGDTKPGRAVGPSAQRACAPPHLPGSAPGDGEAVVTAAAAERARPDARRRAEPPHACVPRSFPRPRPPAVLTAAVQPGKGGRALTRGQALRAGAGRAGQEPASPARDDAPRKVTELRRSVKAPPRPTHGPTPALILCATARPSPLALAASISPAVKGPPSPRWARL